MGHGHLPPAQQADATALATPYSAGGGGTALVLPGGGARGAYQAGVLRGVAEILDAKRCPFPIITGTSAGAINAVSLACSALDFRHGVARLSGVWRHFTVDKVFRCDWTGAAGNLARWGWSLARGGLGNVPVSLLDNTPLRELLETHLRMARIQHAIGVGALRAVAVSAAGFRCGRTVAFYESDDSVKPWKRARREGRPCHMSLDHLMGAVGIPFVFPAVRMQNDFFGDGAVRESAPLSPAIHLGADRLLVVAVRDPSLGAVPELARPSLGEMVGYLLDAVFEDGLYNDLEQLTRLNNMLGEAPQGERRRNQFRRVPAYVISPSRDINAIAARHAHRFPGASKMMLGALGGGEALASFLLFDGQYCREIMRLGYRDCLAQRDALKRFLDAGSDTEAETLHAAKHLPVNS
ncbi:MAG: patatin-like phospholipase family protein [Pseudomonadota bacterium]